MLGGIKKQISPSWRVWYNRYIWAKEETTVCGYVTREYSDSVDVELRKVKTYRHKESGDIRRVLGDKAVGGATNFKKDDIINGIINVNPLYNGIEIIRDKDLYSGTKWEKVD